MCVSLTSDNKENQAIATTSFGLLASNRSHWVSVKKAWTIWGSTCRAFLPQNPQTSVTQSNKIVDTEGITVVPLLKPSRTTSSSVGNQQPHPRIPAVRCKPFLLLWRTNPEQYSMLADRVLYFRESSAVFFSFITGNQAIWKEMRDEELNTHLERGQIIKRIKVLSQAQHMISQH